MAERDAEPSGETGAPDEAARTWLILLGAAWLVAWGGSFVAFSVTEPSGDGFVRGMNRVLAFLGWQGVAGMISVALWGVGRRWPRGSGVRRASRVPALMALALVAGIAAMIAWARFAP